jgi:electron transfer flavoprotein alpha subunit
VIAVVPVRRGELPSGAEEAVAEAGGRVLVAGEGARRAASSLSSCLGARPAPPRATAGDEPPKPDQVRYCELGTFQPGRWGPGLARLVAGEDVVLLPASPDGRDLAPRLAAALGRPLLAGALAVSPQRVDLVRLDGRLIEEHLPTGPFVATLLPGSRSVPSGGGPPDALQDLEVGELALDLGDERDARLVEIVDADPAAVDLAEAERVVAGGAGLKGDGAFELLAELGRCLQASVGATRVVTDAGLVAHERQIGTTGVSISPRCYLAFGISGAAQHLGGIGDPAHVVAANLDAGCPMMAMADLALVTDAAELVAALLELLEARG